VTRAAQDPSPPKFLLLGEILRPHSVHGEVKVRVLTEYPERIPTLPAVFVGAGADSASTRPMRVESMRMHQGFALIRFAEIADRTQAERLRGLFLMVRIEDAIPLDEGEFYLYQILGLPVLTDDGHALGVIAEVLETGANDVYVVRDGPYGEVLIPVTPETIVRTDIAAREVIVRLPEGLLPGTLVTDDED
jgi:16S rRNA processing protein RimM